MPHSPACWTALLAVFGLGIVGCGGSGELRNGVYRDGEARYRIGDLGSDWRAMEVGGQNDLAYHDAQLGAIVQVNATCDPASDVPLSSLTNHLLFGFTDREYQSQEVIPMDEREALRTHVVAKLDGVPRELLLFVLKKNRCVYDFALIAPPGANFARAAAQFEPFVQGFTTELGTTP